ncbi:MAG: cation:proton antiporter [Clostridium sp.]|uniref:cation:proton antiporter n=1 Tax=Clostridium sp. TaxID=1506 RepID=UPI002672AD1D|nr:cation:proton antiporter [Clostridium sp.]MDD7682604.1 cation:proton antiporter [Clostridium sp.]MDY2579228.1 cation:proton antiporter [Clostridium sp.]
MSYRYLLDLALILLSTKVLSLVTKRFKLPQVVGALLAGLILGPAVFNIIEETDFIKQLAEVGVIVLLFNAGLESNLSEFKKSGKTSFIVAVMGVMIPLIGGTILAYCINHGKVENVSVFVQNIFIGSVLTATSVSITVETLRELGKVSTSVGNIIVGAAIIDDVLGMLVLTIITSLAGSSVSVIKVIVKIVGFFIFSIIVGIITYKLFNKWVDKYDIDKRRFVIVSFVICLLLSFSAEEFFGVADITGAYIAGLVLSSNKETIYITKRFETLSYILLSPVFFASVGLNVKLPDLNGEIVIITIALIVVAILTKIIGCGLGAKLCGYNNMESIQIGSGMVTRGEVTLIIASKGLALGLMSSYFLTPVILMVVFTSIFTPILLKIVFSKDKSSVPS